MIAMNSLYISPIYTFVNIPALLLKNTLRFLIRARIFTKVGIRDMCSEIKTLVIKKNLQKILIFQYIFQIPNFYCFQCLQTDRAHPNSMYDQRKKMITRTDKFENIIVIRFSGDVTDVSETNYAFYLENNKN
jgi:hypothetical protein